MREVRKEISPELIAMSERVETKAAQLEESIQGLGQSIDALVAERDSLKELLSAIVEEFTQTYDAESDAGGRWTHAASISTDLMQSARRLVSGCKPTRHIDFVFSGRAPNMTLVEVENDKGSSFLAGEWLAPINGLTVLRIRPDCFEKGGAA